MAQRCCRGGAPSLALRQVATTWGTSFAETVEQQARSVGIAVWEAMVFLALQHPRTVIGGASIFNSLFELVVVPQFPLNRSFELQQQDSPGHSRGKGPLQRMYISILAKDKGLKLRWMLDWSVTVWFKLLVNWCSVRTSYFQHWRWNHAATARWIPHTSSSSGMPRPRLPGKGTYAGFQIVYIYIYI